MLKLVVFDTHCCSQPVSQPVSGFTAGGYSAMQLYSYTALASVFLPRPQRGTDASRLSGPFSRKGLGQSFFVIVGVHAWDFPSTRPGPTSSRGASIRPVSRLSARTTTTSSASASAAVAASASSCWPTRPARNEDLNARVLGCEVDQHLVVVAPRPSGQAAADFVRKGHRQVPGYHRAQATAVIVRVPQSRMRIRRDGVGPRTVL